MPLSSVCVMCVSGTSMATSESTPFLGISRAITTSWIGSREISPKMLVLVLEVTLSRTWRTTRGRSSGSEMQSAPPTVVVIATWTGRER